jgi:hypothetical protein
MLKQACPNVRPEMLKRVDAETSLPWRQPQATFANVAFKRVQHDNRVWFRVFVIPNSVRDLGLLLISGFNAPPLGGVLYFKGQDQNERQINYFRGD